MGGAVPVNEFPRDPNFIMRRREIIAALPAVALLGAAGARHQGGFHDQEVRALARRLASRPYSPPAGDLPPHLAALGYDAYRDIRFKPAKALWRDTASPFQLQFFHRGGLFRDKVEMFEVVDGQARAIAYSPDLFIFGAAGPVEAGADLGFAGFRVHGVLHSPGQLDEIAAFLGASYFRAVAKGGGYGLSARGLSLGSGEPGEEFPAFRSFWIERPRPGARTVVVHALMDGPSLAGAFRFAISPGPTTAFDVTASLFPRLDLAKAGIAPLTSMYLFGPEQPRRFDDFRPEVHDSDGLLIAGRGGGRLWRTLSNPIPNRTSAFSEEAPKGFGLIQRQTGFSTYEDLEARYDRRPSLWVEPLADLGRGEVRLVELGARHEGEDNIVAFWRPAQILQAGGEHRFSYRLNWGPEPVPAPGLARAAQWRTGHGRRPGSRRFFVDFDGAAAPGADVAADVGVSAGAAFDIVIQPNQQTGGVRLNFSFDPAGARESELRAALKVGGRLCSETWIHRWAA